MHPHAHNAHLRSCGLVRFRRPPRAGRTENLRPLGHNPGAATSTRCSLGTRLQSTDHDCKRRRLAGHEELHQQQDVLAAVAGLTFALLNTSRGSHRRRRAICHRRQDSLVTPDGVCCSTCHADRARSALGIATVSPKPQPIAARQGGETSISRGSKAANTRLLQRARSEAPKLSFGRLSAFAPVLTITANRDDTA